MVRPACFLTTPTSWTRSARWFNRSSNLVSTSSMRLRISSRDSFDFSILIFLQFGVRRFARFDVIGGAAFRRHRGFWQRDLSEFGRVPEFIQILKTEMLHKMLRRDVQKRA